MQCDKLNNLHRPGISSTKKAFQKSCLIYGKPEFSSAMQQIVHFAATLPESTLKESSYRRKKTPPIRTWDAVQQFVRFHRHYHRLESTLKKHPKEGKKHQLSISATKKAFERVVSYIWTIFENNTSHLMSGRQEFFQNETLRMESLSEMGSYCLGERPVIEKMIDMLALSLLWMWLVLYRQGVVHAQTKLTFRNIRFLLLSY